MSSVPLKPCKHCKEPLPETVEYFDIQRNGKNGLTAFCRPCRRARAAYKKAVKAGRVYQSVLPGFLYCTGCKATKSISEFHKCKSTKNGYHLQCKPCRAADSLARRLICNPPPPPLPQGHKRCSVCKLVKPYGVFSKSSYVKDGHKSNCRECDHKAYKAAIAADPFYIQRRHQRRRSLRVAASGDHTSEDIKAKLELQGGRCYYCDEPLTRFEVDHKIPLRLGGSNWPANICCSCRTCNRRKGHKPFRQFIQELEAA